jgi:hypothetical protein
MAAVMNWIKHSWPSSYTWLLHPVAFAKAYQVYTSCMEAITDEGRYHLLSIYMNDETNKDSYYYKMLIKMFGADYFIPKTNLISSIVNRAMNLQRFFQPALTNLPDRNITSPEYKDAAGYSPSLPDI